MDVVLQGIVRDTGGYAVTLNWTMSNIYGLRPGDVSPPSVLCWLPPLANAHTLLLVTRCRCGGRRQTWAGWWATPTSATPPCSTATAPFSMRFVSTVPLRLLSPRRGAVGGRCALMFSCFTKIKEATPSDSLTCLNAAELRSGPGSKQRRR